LVNNAREYQDVGEEGVGLCERNSLNRGFVIECSRFLDQRKQAEMEWLQEPKQSSVNNLSSVRLEASRHFRNRKKQYLKAKIDELETNSKNRHIRLV
jgi:hypothetical protein